MEEHSVVPCCPKLDTAPCCDVLTFDYRLMHRTTVRGGNQRIIVPVEVKIVTRFERCPGPMSLGDLVYSTTLLPGEKVRLFTTDRRTRFTFDSSTNVSYRNEQTSEEHFYMASISDFMSDVTVRDTSRATNTNKGSAEGHAGTSSLLGSIFSGPSVDVSGSYNNSSTSDFVRELSEHARSSHHRAEMGARASSTVSIGEAQTRSHVSTESQDHFESSNREFSNPNRCHAITFFFYRINKMQTIKYTTETIQRRVIEQTDNTKVTNNDFASTGQVSVIPNAVFATDKERLEVEERGRASVAAQKKGTISDIGRASSVVGKSFDLLSSAEPLGVPIRTEALAQIDKELVAVGLLDQVGGVISPDVKERHSFVIQSCLPTPGLYVKGCLDECNICEPELMKEIELNIEHKKLENELLKRQTELLEKSQEYRCCPAESTPSA
ncbi:MAG TPA: hypothetical protein VH481_08965 [Nitrososphaeraceae archaeon]|jgi:hypothetical protein